MAFKLKYVRCLFIERSEWGKKRDSDTVAVEFGRGEQYGKVILNSNFQDYARLLVIVWRKENQRHIIHTFYIPKGRLARA